MRTEPERVVISSFAFSNAYAIGDNSCGVQGQFNLPAKYFNSLDTWVIESVNTYPAPFGTQPGLSGAVIQVTDSVANIKIGQNVIPSNASGVEYYTYDVGTELNMGSLAITGLSYQAYLYFNNPATVNTAIGVYSTIVLRKVGRVK